MSAVLIKYEPQMCCRKCSYGDLEVIYSNPAVQKRPKNQDDVLWEWLDCSCKKCGYVEKRLTVDSPYECVECDFSDYRYKILSKR